LFYDKQDCENAAAKRWLTQHGNRFGRLKVTVLGDDLYCHQPLCQQLVDHQIVAWHFGQAWVEELVGFIRNKQIYYQ
jgi:hypothetical protein